MESQHREVRLAEGRVLEVVDTGGEGRPVILIHHGTPGGADLFAGWVADAERRGVRLIGYARPGYRGSSREAGRSVSGAAADVRAIAEALGIRRLATYGFSGGGPHALACAALLPDLVAAAAALASVAPYGAEGLDYLEGMGEGNVEEFKTVLQGGEPALRAGYAKLAANPPTDVEQLLGEMSSILSPPDREVIRRTLGHWMLDGMGDALRQGLDGWVDDDLAFVKPWGFEVSAIRVPLQLWQGEQDLMVPAGHGRWLASQLPRAEWTQLPEAGHLTLLVDQVPAVHAWLLERL